MAYSATRLYVWGGWLTSHLKGDTANGLLCFEGEIDLYSVQMLDLPGCATPCTVGNRKLPSYFGNWICHDESFPVKATGWYY